MTEEQAIGALKAATSTIWDAAHCLPNDSRDPLFYIHAQLRSKIAELEAT